LLKQSESPIPSGLKQSRNPIPSGLNRSESPDLPGLPPFPLLPCTFCLFPSSPHSPWPETRSCLSYPSSRPFLSFPPLNLLASRGGSHLFRMSILGFRISPSPPPPRALQMSSALYKSPPFMQNKPCAKLSWCNSAGVILPGQRLATRPE